MQSDQINPLFFFLFHSFFFHGHESFLGSSLQGQGLNQIKRIKPKSFVETGIEACLESYFVSSARQGVQRFKALPRHRTAEG